MTYSQGEQAAAEHEAEEEGCVEGVTPAARQAGATVFFAGGAAAQQPQGAVPTGATGSMGAGDSLDSQEAVGNTPETAQAVIGNASAAAATVIGMPNYVPQMSAEEAEKLNEAQSSYVDELKELVETLKKVNEQSARLTRDSEEMENLNRTLTGISKVYEMQLKGASQQIGTIDQINDQSRRMAQQIEQLNQIYARMIEAMTVNMRAAAPGANTAPSASSATPTSQI